jgi:hypothetical protein
MATSKPNTLLPKCAVQACPNRDIILHRVFTLMKLMLTLFYGSHFDRPECASAVLVGTRFDWSDKHTCTTAPGIHGWNSAAGIN